jgi:phage anti-repressor protein
MSTTKSIQFKAVKNSLAIASGSGNELVIIQRGDQSLVDSRLLHKRLKVSTRYAMWIQRRIEKYGFEENVDFFPIMGKTSSTGGRPTVDYYFTLDMAKEMAMLEENETGRQIRRYFIEAEKRSRTSVLAADTEGAFKGIKSVMYQGYKCYPYLSVLKAIGYSTRSGAVYARKQKYHGHFFKLFGRNFVTNEYARHLIEEFAVYQNRIGLQTMLPFAIKKGGAQ